MGEGGGGSSRNAIVDMLQVSQWFLCSIVTVFQSFKGSIHSNVVSHDPFLSEVIHT